MMRYRIKTKTKMKNILLIQSSPGSNPQVPDRMRISRQPAEKSRFITSEGMKGEIADD
jgi:hypothetical protein